MEKIIFEYSRTGRNAYSLPEAEHKHLCILPRAKAPRLPEVSEVDVVRHYTALSTQNYGVDTGFYPLGSCTMKYNPKINEDIVALWEILNLNPNQSANTVQGLLHMLYDLEQYLCQIFGYTRFTLQPAAGAHGELAGLLIIRAYHQKRKDIKRTVILVPDSSHGTNPATAALAGFQLVTVKSNEHGHVDMVELKKHLNDTVAGLMMTNPSTLGLFEENILEIAQLVHDAGGLLYYDGANANATLGVVRPADMGFDVCHLNLHKTFSTPHGGGGPGAGPVGVVERLVPFLPRPMIDFNAATKQYTINNELPDTIGRVHGFFGNVGVLLRAYAYIRMMGSQGLHKASEMAVLNANYIKARLTPYYDIPHPEDCQHEFVISAKGLKKEFGISALDIAKRLIDYGYHPMTIYFPLIVSECMMIEPTETESKETLDAFCDVMIKIAEEAKTQPELLKNAPMTAVVKRLDEVKAVKEPRLKYWN